MKSLCETCTHGIRIRGESERETLIFCTQLPKNKEIQFTVTECSMFRAKNTLNLYQMQEIAYILVQKGDKIGFVSAKKFREQQNLQDGADLIPGQCYEV